MKNLTITINGTEINVPEDAIIGIKCNDEVPYELYVHKPEFQDMVIKNIRNSFKVHSKEYLELLQAENNFNKNKQTQDFIDFWKLHRMYETSHIGHIQEKSITSKMIREQIIKVFKEKFTF